MSLEGCPHCRTRGYFASYFCTCTTFTAWYTYKSTCVCVCVCVCLCVCVCVCTSYTCTTYKSMRFLHSDELIFVFSSKRSLAYWSSYTKPVTCFVRPFGQNFFWHHTKVRVRSKSKSYTYFYTRTKSYKRWELEKLGPFSGNITGDQYCVVKITEILSLSFFLQELFDSQLCFGYYTSIYQNQIKWLYYLLTTTTIHMHYFIIPNIFCYHKGNNFFFQLRISSCGLTQYKMER